MVVGILKAEKLLNKIIMQEKIKNKQDKYENVFNAVEYLPVVAEENREWSIEELEKRIVESFKQAGEISLKENSGRIFLSLSGGLDSTLALAILKREFPDKEIVTFSVGGNENHADIRFSRIATSSFPTTHHEIIPSPIQIQNAILEYKEAFPEDDLKEKSKGGDFDVWLLLKEISKHKPKIILATDGIDELMGGYWDHAKGFDEQDKMITDEERKQIYRRYWEKLIPNHLKPLTKKAEKLGIKILFPCLDKDLIEYISKIPINDRVKNSVRKLPLRKLAEKYDVPDEIIKRKKRGQVGMLEIDHDLNY